MVKYNKNIFYKILDYNINYKIRINFNPCYLTSNEPKYKFPKNDKNQR